MARPLRLHGFNYIGAYRYLITTCTYRRRNAFSDPRMATAVLSRFLPLARSYYLAVLAYCVMPDPGSCRVVASAGAECPGLRTSTNPCTTEHLAAPIYPRRLKRDAWAGAGAT